MPYTIRTSRTKIRCWDPRDARRLQDAINDSLESLLPWMPWAKDEPKQYRSKIETIRFFRGSFDLGKDFVFGIFDHEESEVLGGCGLHTRGGAYSLEIGYWINREYQNRGYATEVTRALMKVAFELSGIDNVRICCDVKNAASLRVIEKVGFEKEGILLHQQKNTNDEFQDFQVAVFLRDSYTGSEISRQEIVAYDAVGDTIEFDEDTENE